MLRKSVFQQAATLALAATLATPTVGFSAERKLIFPGHPIPAELGYTPLKVGSSADSEVQIMPRDWFLLKNQQIALANPVPGKDIEYIGPVLETTNAQIYFRLISGMILKESMLQLGMSSTRARRFIENAQQKGLDFEKTALKDLGDIPEGLKELYNNWERPNAKIAMLPYLVLPLAVAHDQSQFQHFFKGGIEDAEAQKTCSTINTAAPLAPIQNKLNERNKALENIDTELRNANARLEQSIAEQVRVTGVIKDASDQINSHSTCFTIIKDRVSRGGTMPDQACLALAQKAMIDAKLEADWAKFIGNNLKNDKGDFAVKQQAELELNALEASLAETKNRVHALQDSQEKFKAEQVDSDQKKAALEQKLAGYKIELDKMIAGEKEKKTEQSGLQTVGFKLLSENYKQEIGEAAYVAAINGTKERAARLAVLKKDLNEITVKTTAFQTAQAALTTQIGHLAAATDVRKAQLQSIDEQLNAQGSGLSAKLTSLETQVKVATPIYLELQDKASFSEYITSILARRVAALSQSRDEQLNQLKKEEGLAEKYKQEIVKATAVKDAQYGSIAGEVGSLEALIASYRDVKQMGWFLETDCLARTNLAGKESGIYLGRAKINESSSKNLPTTPVDGGRWGLFNLDYDHFQTAIQSGILLNVPSYIQMAVHQLTENYDYAMNRQWDTNVAKCNDPEAKGNAGSVISALKSAFAIWNEGSDAAAKEKALQCRVIAAPAAAVAQSGQKPARRRYNRRGQEIFIRPAVSTMQPQVAVRNFSASFNRLVQFDGSVLDLALPQSGRSHDKDLIERKAISLTMRELGILSGQLRSDVASDVRRDEVIKALIRVLANDYEAELAKQNALSLSQSKFEYVFATAAPGKQVAGAGLTVGSTYKVKTLGQVKLFTAPIAKAAYESDIVLSLNDQVTVLPIEGLNAVAESGWVKVQSGNYEGWLPAWTIASSVVLDEAGQEIAGGTKPQNCANARIVESMTNFQRSNTLIQRFSPNVKTKQTSRRSGIWTIDTDATDRVASATTSPQKSYLACGEPLMVNGQVANLGVDSAWLDRNGVDYSKAQAIRIIEARKVVSAKGEELYIPLEEVGGYVQTWDLRRNSREPRIKLGAEIDTATWGLKK